MTEIYVSTDVEVDGPIPGPHSMLSFASAAYLPDKTLLGTFSANLQALPDASGHPDTLAWWSQHQDAWNAARLDPREPEVAMRDYVAWLETLPGQCVFVGYPVAFDFLFVYWYLMRFVGRSPFSHSALDIKTLAMVALRQDYRRSTKSRMPQRWFDPIAHSHVALDDALEQGALFCNILAEVRSAFPKKNA